jgi:hypothetical protein
MCFNLIAAGARLFRLDTGVYLFTVNSHIFRCVNADSDLRATHAEHGDADLASNGDGFADATGQYQHAIPLNWFRKYQGTNTPEMGLASPIIIDCTHRLGHSPSGRAVRASDLRSFGRFDEILYLVEKTSALTLARHKRVEVTPTRLPDFARAPFNGDVIVANASLKA